jgi:hypothetical protein
MKKYVYKDCHDFSRKLINHLQPGTVWHEMTRIAIFDCTEQEFIQELKHIDKETPGRLSKVMGATIYAEFNEIREIRSSDLKCFWRGFNWGLYAEIQGLKK